MSDHEFVRKAAEGGIAEVALANLANERAQSADVKQFAQRMRDDHSRANDELRSLAQRKGWQLPQQPSSEQQATANRLSKLSGAEFDRAYMQEMVKDHKHDVMMFRNAQQHTKDSDLRAWVEKTLPTLEQHRELAHTTAMSVGVTVAHK